MASIKILKKVYFLISLFCVLIVQTMVLATPLPPVAPWRLRPAELSKDPNNLTVSQARDIIKNFVYSGEDFDKIVPVVFAISPQEAALVLQNYIEQYSKKNSSPDYVWSRAVFCLGIVQTDGAKDYLLKLWDIYDRRIEAGQIKDDVWMFSGGVLPLRVIGDAIHLYLWDNGVRQWFVKKIEEAEGLPDSDHLLKSSRRDDRFQLLHNLYLWDIIESVDNGRVITSDKIDVSYVHRPRTVKNISMSADRVVYWIKNLRPLKANMTEKQWKNIRKDPHEYIFDRVVMFLDRSIALTLWENYLKTESSNIKTIEHRLWLTSLWAYSAYFVEMDESLWVPKEDDNLFLQDAIAYVKQLPNGHIRQLAMEALFIVTCYVPDAFENQPINEIREVSKRLLNKNDRESAIIRSEYNKTVMKKVRRHKRSKNDVK